MKFHKNLCLKLVSKMNLNQIYLNLASQSRKKTMEVHQTSMVISLKAMICQMKWLQNKSSQCKSSKLISILKFNKEMQAPIILIQRRKKYWLQLMIATAKTSTVQLKTMIFMGFIHNVIRKIIKLSKRRRSFKKFSKIRSRIKMKTSNLMMCPILDKIIQILINYNNSAKQSLNSTYHKTKMKNNIKIRCYQHMHHRSKRRPSHYNRLLNKCNKLQTVTI